MKNGETLVVTDPRDHAEIIRKEGKLNMVVDLPDTMNYTHGPGSLQALSGQKHNFYRKIFASLLSPAALNSFTPYLHEAFIDMWAELEEKCNNSSSTSTDDEPVVVIQDAICKAQFFLMAKILYGMTPKNTPMEVLMQMREDFDAQLEGHFASPKSAKFLKAKEGSERIHKILADRFNSVLEERRALRSERKNVDFAEEKKDGTDNNGDDDSNIGNGMETIADALLREGVDTDPQVLADIVDNLDLLLEASHGTTMTVTTNTLYYLNHPDNKEKMNKLREEAKQFASKELPSFADLKNNMPYADATIKESMRLAPIVVGLTHAVKDEVEFTFKGQQMQGPASFMLVFAHHFKDANIFPMPDTFVPERWIAGNNEYYVSAEARKTFTPFGAGRHLCLGFKLAELVLKSALYCFARDDSRVIEFDTCKVSKQSRLFPAYSISGGFPGRVVVKT